MALFQTLQDTFDTPTINTFWNVFQDGEVVQENSKLRMTATANSQTNSIDTIPTYDLQDSFVFCEIITTQGDFVSGANIIDFVISAASSSLAIYVFGGNIECWVDTTVAPDTSIFSETYSSVDHRWIRIRHSVSTIYYDKSADGIIWTNMTSIADTNVELTTQGLYLGMNVFGGGDPISIFFDSLNITDLNPDDIWNNAMRTTNTAWSAEAKSGLVFLWSAEVQPWLLDEPWAWDNSPDSINNAQQ